MKKKQKAEPIEKFVKRKKKKLKKELIMLSFVKALGQTTLFLYKSKRIVYKFLIPISIIHFLILFTNVTQFVKEKTTIMVLSLIFTYWIIVLLHFMVGHIFDYSHKKIYKRLGIR